MRQVCFHFDLVSPDTRAWFDQLPELLQGHGVLLDYRPEPPPPGHPAAAWVALLTRNGAPGRWACGQVLARWAVDPLDAVAADVAPRLATGLPLAPAVGGPLPAVVWDGRRFDGPDALARLAAAWLMPPA